MTRRLRTSLSTKNMSQNLKKADKEKELLQKFQDKETNLVHSRKAVGNVEKRQQNAKRKKAKVLDNDKAVEKGKRR